MSLISERGPDSRGLVSCAGEYRLTLGGGKHYEVLSRNIRCTGLRF